MNEHSLILWKELTIAGLNSPVVILILTIVIILMFREKLIKTLSNRNIEIGWGDKSIKLSELSNNLDQEIDPIKEQIEELKQELQFVKAQKHIEFEDKEIKSSASNEEVKTKIYKALASPKFRWRSLESIAKFVRASCDDVLEILESDEKVIVEKAKNGKTLAKFKHR